MNDINVYVFTGRIAKEPEVRGNTGSVTTFTVASNRNQKKNADGTWTGDTDWNNCIVFGSCDLKKGDRVKITGSIQDNNYVDKQGVKKTSKQVVVDSWKVFPQKNSNYQKQQSQQQTNEPDSFPDDDIPM